MQPASAFRRIEEGAGGDAVTLYFEDRPVPARRRDTVAAALLAAGVRVLRTTPVGGRPRGPFCMMGVCFDCLVEIDGEPNQQACMVTVRDGMQVRRMHGAREPGVVND